MGDTGDQRDQVDVVVDELGEQAGGAMYVRCPDGAGVVVVSPHLGRRRRRWAIEHELAHHHLGIVAPPATPAMIQRAEHHAERIAVEHLVPVAELRRLVDDLPDGQGITAGEVAEHFGIPVAVAARALQQLHVS